MKRMSLKEQLMFIELDYKLFPIPFDYVKRGSVVNFDIGTDSNIWHFVVDEFVDNVIRRKLAFEPCGDLVYLDGKKTAKNPVTVYALQQYLTAYIGFKYTHTIDEEAAENFQNKMLKIRNEHEVNP